ncbi:Zinc carboxypeptidase [Bryocella elongata]|uniref:Zinc carboxypeptidase n=1 Tax=Bryocella elongata TaxID=863522 RepID=A0A1H5UFF5_9BACT|nr:M14 metallopeptidase family protein [Bryocella elongata]SEF73719.1 Zinc carboxypeptidase [Bryocella elongata]
MLARRRSSLSVVTALGLAALALTPLMYAQKPRTITTPKQQFGHDIGDDYQLVNYTQESEYLQKLAKESDRMKLVDIGLTAEGRHQYMAIISSPENIAKLDHYREINQKLVLAKGLTDDQAKALAEEGRAIVWIDGGLHASETVGAQQLVETIYELNSKTDPETMRFLHDDIALCTFVNPDGMELVSNWYMRNADPTKREMNVPRLWQKYIGHDDNRDFYISNQAETTNVNRILARVWFPEIVYNHHQAGPAGTVIFMPPFRDPNSYFYDPLIPLGIEAVGTAMHQRLVEEGKFGSTSRTGAPYSTWFNGSLRTVSYFHNQIGLLTEIIGNPTPEPLPLLPSEQLPKNDLVAPIKPQMWHYATSIAYEQTNNRAVLDYASRERTHLLYNIYLMGKDSIQNGSEDHWTVTPKRITALEETAEKEGAHVARGGVLSPDAMNALGPRTQGVPAELYDKVLHDPKMKDARAYVISADQPDFPTATKFVDSLMKTGVEIQQATAPFSVEGKQYPAGSYVVFTAQAFRPQVLDMFEPQDHPNDFAYPGGPPNRPYDTTGWTLAFQMGVHFDRYTEAVTGPFAVIKEDLAKPLPGKILGPTGTPAGYLVDHEYNDSYTLTNRLLKAGQPVYWLKDTAAVEGKTLPAGALWLPYSAETAKTLETATKTLGISAYAVAKAPAGAAIQVHPVRIGLVDTYGGSMPSGWIRWLFDQFEFPYTVVYSQELDAGNLNAKYDVLLFADGIIRNPSARGGMGFFGRAPKPEDIPAEFRPWLGSITPAKTFPQLQAFADNGGTLLTIGSSTALASFLKLPVVNAPMEMVKGELKAVPPDRFYIPGSLLKAHVDTKDPIAYGVAPNVIVDFDNSPSFTLDPNAALTGVHAIAWYDDANLLASGWAWGQGYIDHTTAIAEAPLGKGKIVLYGPEVTFRGQPHATFKFLFNGVLSGAASESSLQ